MGVNFDIILADEANVEQIAKLSGYTIDIKFIRTKILDQVTLARLQSIITGEPFEAVVGYYDVPIFEGGLDGPWIHKVPAGFAFQLAELSESNLVKFGNQWFNSEEIQFAKVDLPYVQELLRELHNFALEAQSSGKALLLKSSL